MDHARDRRAEADAKLLGRPADDPGEHGDRDGCKGEREHWRRVGEVRNGGDSHEGDGHRQLDHVAARHGHIIGAVAGDELREVMRRFPAPVAVVTTEVDGERFGLTVGSLVSLSLEPPLVGISIGRESSSHEPFRRADGWTASLLSAGQASMAQHFARSGIPPLALFAGIELREGPRGPLLEGALGWLECRTWAQYEAGDHTFFVGEIESIELGAAGDALVYRGGGYHPA